MLNFLRDVGIVWGVVKPTPQESAAVQLKRAELELLEAEKEQEEAAAKVELLKVRVGRLRSYRPDAAVQIPRNELDGLARALKS